MKKNISSCKSLDFPPQLCYKKISMDTEPSTPVQTKDLVPPSTKTTPAILESNNINQVRVCQQIDAGLSAMKQMVVDGEVLEFPDHLVRHKYVETAREKIGDVRVQPTQLTQVNINLNASDLDTLKTITASLNKLSERLELNGDDNVIDITSTASPEC